MQLPIPLAPCFVVLLALCAFLVPAGASPSAVLHPRPQRQSVPATDLTALLSMVSGITSGKDASWTSATAACSWQGVTCDTNGLVNQVNWGYMNLAGTLNLMVTPALLAELYVDSNQLTGLEVDWLSLPPALTTLSLSSNSFNSTPSFDALPSTLNTLNLNSNQFTGTPSFALLPASLSTINLGYNLFCGDMVGTSGAASIVSVSSMCIGGFDGTWNSTSNGLSCPFCTPHPHMEDLAALVSMVSGFENGKDASWTVATPSCSWNGITCTNTIVTQISWGYMYLTGTANLANVPRFTKQLFLTQNQLSGTIDNWASLPAYLAQFDLSNNVFIGDVSAESLPTTLETLNLNSNNFTGSPNLSLLPASLSTVNLGYNHFCGVIKASNATYNDIDANYMCTGGVSPQWVPMSTTFVCPPCV